MEVEWRAYTPKVCVYAVPCLFDQPALIGWLVYFGRIEWAHTDLVVDDTKMHTHDIFAVYTNSDMKKLLSFCSHLQLFSSLQLLSFEWIGHLGDCGSHCYVIISLQIRLVSLIGKWVPHTCKVFYYEKHHRSLRTQREQLEMDNHICRKSISKKKKNFHRKANRPNAQTKQKVEANTFHDCGPSVTDVDQHPVGSIQILMVRW